MKYFLIFLLAYSFRCLFDWGMCYYIYYRKHGQEDFCAKDVSQAFIEARIPFLGLICTIAILFFTFIPELSKHSVEVMSEALKDSLNISENDERKTKLQEAEEEIEERLKNQSQKKEELV